MEKIREPQKFDNLSGKKIVYFNVITNYEKVRGENMRREGKGKQVCMNNILNAAEIA